MSEARPDDETKAIEGVPPESWESAVHAAQAIVRPLERFLHVEAASGILLLIAAAIAMIWANSPWHDSYHALWHTKVALGIGSYNFTHDLHFWINDGLMVIFFFVVGLEIRREIHSGELSDFKRASLPVAAAVGGMVVPALIYISFNRGSPDAMQGWGVPMATDIAFAVGVLALLGKRVPAALRVLLLALAIIDDVGAILVIALFYSSGVTLIGLAMAALGVMIILAMQRFGIRSPLLYVFPGIVVWAGMLQAGIHPTIAGVIIGLLTPVRPWLGGKRFLDAADRAITEFKEKLRPDVDQHDLAVPLGHLKQARREALSPVLRLELALHPWVSFVIMPIFALANAGVTLGGMSMGSGNEAAVGLGVGLGLALGKPVGIVAASLLAVWVGLSALPRGLDWRGLLVVGMVGGIGFTMALFIAALAFPSNAELLAVAKVAVLIGSAAAGVMGLVFGVIFLPRTHPKDIAQTVREAELSTEM